MLVRFERVPRTLFDQVFDFEHELDTLFGSHLTPGVPTDGNYPLMNITDRGEEIVIAAELPGVKKEDLKISVHDGVLELSGERKDVEMPKEARWLRRELETGSFVRAITLPREVDQEKVSAELKNGILNIVLPRVERAKPREIAIQ